MEWENAQNNIESAEDHSIFGEAPRKLSLAEAAETSDDELYRKAVAACEQVAKTSPELAGSAEMILKVDHLTGVGIGIAALAAANVQPAA